MHVTSSFLPGINSMYAHPFLPASAVAYIVLLILYLFRALGEL